MFSLCVERPSIKSLLKSKKKVLPRRRPRSPALVERYHAEDGERHLLLAGHVHDALVRGPVVLAAARVPDLLQAAGAVVRHVAGDLAEAGA